jgi:hypothetical protein
VERKRGYTRQGSSSMRDQPDQPVVGPGYGRAPLRSSHGFNSSRVSAWSCRARIDRARPRGATDEFLAAVSRATDTARAAARAAVEAFGGEARVVRFWDEPEEHDVALLVADDRPGPGFTLYSTVTLHQ